MRPGIALRDVMAEEISAFTPRRTATGLMTFEGADGAHDDLVMGLRDWCFQQKPTDARDDWAVRL